MKTTLVSDHDRTRWYSLLHIIFAIYINDLAREIKFVKFGMMSGAKTISTFFVPRQHCFAGKL